jgi:hypothetical protein
VRAVLGSGDESIPMPRWAMRDETVDPLSGWSADPTAADRPADRTDADELREATIWIDGLERIARQRGILRAIDCSARPMYPAVFRDRAWTPFD